MGMDAQLIGVGPFSPMIKEHLDYQPSCYDGVERGTIIITILATCSSTAQSRKLAAALDIDPWDFSQHRLLTLSHSQIERAGEAIAGGEDSAMLMAERLSLFVACGFTFFYLPNG